MQKNQTNFQKNVKIYELSVPKCGLKYAGNMSRDSLDKIELILKIRCSVDSKY